MIKRVIFSIGFSIIIAVISGYALRQEKYFSVLPNSPKTEITEEFYNDDSDKEFVKKELPFNTEKALTIGFASLGLFLIISAIKKSKNN